MIDTQKRVVVTGIGAVTPVGNDAPTTWQNLIDGVCGVDRITQFDVAELPTKIAAEVKNFDPTEYMSRKDARRLSRFVHFALTSAKQAATDATLDFSVEDPTRIGVEIGSALGGVPIIESQSVVLHTKGFRRINPILIPASLSNMGACFTSIEMNILGPVNTPVAACATGIVSVGEAMRRIIWGDADVIFAGGADSTVNPLAVMGFHRLGALTARNDTPHRALTPFDAERDGTVIGEGAAVLVLESLEHAQNRGARILAEVTSYALTADAYHVAAPLMSGDGAARAMSGALKSASLSPQQIDFVVAHATGTPLNDAAETTALKTAFGDRAYDIPISGIKGMTGHMMGAAGAVSCLTAVKAIETGVVPPTVGLETPDPDCDLDYVPKLARRVNVRVAMANAFGFGGQNASIIFRKWYK